MSFSQQEPTQNFPIFNVKSNLFGYIYVNVVGPLVFDVFSLFIVFWSSFHPEMISCLMIVLYAYTKARLCIALLMQH